ncbi:GGDEF domain-containing protein [Thiohalomonas denitrificans]|uniref:diguanylate cyclase n=1 Tax=Thiohalomonas denitrificans TaxID=415747 RepID=A0A1G5PK10_9GAMM|nr:diguanylate cyclase [Thiohalomonas denitrificans]SCZ49389.1 diguanylate cyclase (GGDEF) domain-containing protein [Thiohalomonas denitrificans]
MKVLLAFMDRRSKAFIVLFCGTLGIVIALVDVATGPEISSAIFYALPISLCAWYVGRWPGVFMAVASAVLWYSADISAGAPYSHGAIPVWNALTRLGFFLILVFLLSAFQNRLKDEQKRAVTDPLTAVANSRAFYEAAEQEFVRSRRYHHPFSIAFIDLDNFKHINDAFGHAAGDVLLQRAAWIMRDQTRGTDVVARLGGDEFVILFIETGAEAARQAVSDLREKLLAAMKEAGWPVTFSIGVLTYQSPPTDVREMVNQADQLMYTVKKSGKDGCAHALGTPVETHAVTNSHTPA